MFEYNICNRSDSKLFYRQCIALEKNVPGLQVSTILQDVDGTLVQCYEHVLGKVTVKNDLQVDALYVISEFDLLPYFENGKM